MDRGDPSGDTSDAELTNASEEPLTMLCSLPLARLLAIALRTLVDDLHVRLRERGWLDVRPSFGFVLLAVRDQPTTATELATLMGTTKQATSKLIEAMMDAGYVERAGSGTDGRRRPVRITRRGTELLVAVEEIYRELEAGWATVIGRSALDSLRGDLTRVLTQGGETTLPAVRPPA